MEERKGPPRVGSPNAFNQAADMEPAVTSDHVEPTAVPTANGSASGGSEASPKRKSFIDTLYPPGEKGGFGPRLKNHYVKCWPCELVVFLAGVLIIALILVYVVFPKVAQSNFNESSLALTGEVATDPDPTSVNLQLTSSAYSPSIYHPRLSPFTAGLYLLNRPRTQPMIQIDLPQLEVITRTTISINQRVQVLDMPQFVEYNELVMNSSDFQIGFYGRPVLHEMAFPAIKVDYQKVVVQKGLNSLMGFNITDFNISLTGYPDGTNLVGTAYIPNPTVQTLELGNCSYNLSVDGQLVGNATLPNVLLKPGDNYTPIKSTTDQSAIIDLITSKYQDGVVPIDNYGVSSVYNGQEIPYYTAGIKAVPVHINLNLAPALAANGLNLTQALGGGPKAKRYIEEFVHNKKREVSLLE